MKLLYAKARNFVGIKQGTGLDEIEIRFRNGRLVLIRGKNGSGKSSLYRILDPFPNDSIDLVKGEPAYKELHYEANGEIVKLIIEHPVLKTLDPDGFKVRATTRGYIKKITPTGEVELNPSGNITTYKDLLETLFKMDPNFVSLSKISTEDKGIVEKTPANRKKFVASNLSDIEVYNNIYKTLNKRSSVYRSSINSLATKIASIGDADRLRSSLISIERRIEKMNNDIEDININIAKSHANISIKDPDGSIQARYMDINIKKTSAIASIKKIQDQISYIFEKYGIKDIGTIEECKMYSEELRNETIRNESTIDSKEMDINNSINSREEELQSIQRLTAQLDSLKSDFNFQDLKSIMKIYRDNMAEYEKFFNQINVNNAINISKDEYVTGLNTLKSIQNMLGAFSSSNYSHIIREAVTALSKNINYSEICEKMKLDIDKIEARIKELESKKQYYLGLISREDILKLRPGECRVDTCPFIKESVEAASKQPRLAMESLDKELKNLYSDLASLKKKYSENSDIESSSRELRQIANTINNSRAILSKLPVGDELKYSDKFLKCISDGRDPFYRLEALYKYIDKANIFEEYKSTKEALSKAESEFKIYESKNEVIENLIQSIELHNEKLDKLSSSIDVLRQDISILKSKNERYSEVLKVLDSLIIYYTDYTNAEKEVAECDRDILTLEKDMKEISIDLENIDRNKATIKDIKDRLTPIKSDRDGILHGLKLLDEYNEEMKQLKDNFEFIEVVKKYSTPTSAGIQNLYSQVYLDQTFSMANDLLSNLFDGRLKILKPVINENTFNIPCISMNTGMAAEDISYCSRSEKSIISMIIGFVMLKQSSSIYNILRLDEIDEGLDTRNRLMFMDILTRLMDMLEVEQTIMISHTMELDTSMADIIQFKDDNPIIGDNVIFSLAI